MPEILKLDHPSRKQVVERAAAVIRQGGVIIFPTDTTYGLGADPFNHQAVERLYRIKERDPDKPILLLIGKPADLKRLTARIPPIASRLIERFWPGPLTLILPAAPDLKSYQLFRTGKIAVRLPDYQISRQISLKAKVPLTATSANLSGFSSCTDPSSLSNRLLEGIDLLIDAGKSPRKTDSTIVDTCPDPPLMIREGEISFQELEKYGITNG